MGRHGACRIARLAPCRSELHVAVFSALTAGAATTYGMPIPSLRQAASGRVTPWSYDEDAARADLDALAALLTARDELSEREDVLPSCAIIRTSAR